MRFDNRPFAEGLTQAFEEAVARLITRIGESDFTVLYDRVHEKGQQAVFEKLMASSAFFVEQVARHRDWLMRVLADGSLLHASYQQSSDWDQALESMIGSSVSEAEHMRTLRIFRNRHMLGILWRDAAQISTIEAAFLQLTQLADCCIRFAVRSARAALLPKYGDPYGSESDEIQSLVVLAMGKLGGKELNFSSDIDLIFAYPESGATRGGRQSLDNQTYYSTARWGDRGGFCFPRRYAASPLR
ncbi:hypothetical protein N9K98_10910 [Luminiphilus sp.]|nr:hypothetical protein [Luminiphilus sp.]